MPSKKHSFNVLIDDRVFQKLIDLAQTQQLSMGAVVRRLIVAAQTMLIQNQPTCASGQVCLVPHLHAPRPAPTPEVPK